MFCVRATGGSPKLGGLRSKLRFLQIAHFLVAVDRMMRYNVSCTLEATRCRSFDLRTPDVPLVDVPGMLSPRGAPSPAPVACRFRSAACPGAAPARAPNAQQWRVRTMHPRCCSACTSWACAFSCTQPNPQCRRRPAARETPSPQHATHSSSAHAHSWRRPRLALLLFVCIVDKRTSSPPPAPHPFFQNTLTPF